MKVIRTAAFGGPEVLTFEDIADPTPGAGEVVVDIKGEDGRPEETLESVQAALQKTIADATKLEVLFGKDLSSDKFSAIENAIKKIVEADFAGADAVLADGAFLQEAVDASGGELVIVEKVLLGGGIGIGVRESDGELKGKLNAAIDTIKADGRLNTIIVKWFSEEQAVY